MKCEGAVYTQLLYREQMLHDYFQTYIIIYIKKNEVAVIL